MKKIMTMVMVLFLCMGTLSAQTANVDATANVYDALGLSVLSNLSFGGLVAGQEKTVGYDNSDAAVVQIDGTNPAGVNVSFTLPSNLTDGTGNTLPISFGTTSGAYNTENSTTGATEFDPNTGFTNVTLDETSGDLFVYFGGTVTAGGTQPSGEYTGTVTLTVEYN